MDDNIQTKRVRVLMDLEVPVNTLANQLEQDIAGYLTPMKPIKVWSVEVDLNSVE